MYVTYYVPNESGNVLSGAILGYDDTMFVSSGGTALETTVNSSGTIYIDGGGIAQDTVVNSSGYIGLSSGGMASDTTVNDGGFIDVYSFGKADGVTVSSGGSFGVYFTASATGVEMEEGAALRIYMDYYTILSGTSGGRELSISNGIADGLTIESGGFLYASGYTTVSNTTVKPGGHLAVYDNAAGIIEDGGYVYIGSNADTVTFAAHEFKDVEVNGSAVTVHSGTTATNTAIGSGGTMFVYKGGLANSAAVTGGIISGSNFYSGLLQLYSGASANGITAGSGGLVRIEKGATVTNLTENGGGFEFAEGFDMSGVNFLSNSISGQTLSGLVTVHAGTTATDLVISNGAFHLYEGGSAYNVTMGLSGYYDCPGFIHSNAVASGLSGYRFTIESGAVVYDLTGGAKIAGTVSRATVNNYGSATIQSGGKLISATVNVDGMGVGVFVQSGGTLEDSIFTNGYGEVSSGGTVTNLTVNNGYLYVYSGATVEGLNFSAGTLSVTGGSVTGLVLAGEQTYLWLRVDPTTSAFVSGTMGEGTPILLKDGKFEHFKTSRIGLSIANGGVVNDITFEDGDIVVSSGGTATNIDAGGGVHVSGGGTLTSAIFRGKFIPDSRYESGGYYTSGGGYLVILGGTVSDVTFEGADLVMSGGTLQNAVASSGNMFVSGNATVRDLTMNGETVSAFDAVFENTKITDYSYMSMGYGATATGTILSDTQVNRSSGSVTWTEDRGGFLYVYNGGIAVDTTVGNACRLAAAYGGSASKTVVNSGGSLYLSAKNNSYYGYEGCGLADDVTVQSGGWIHVGKGASATDLKLEKGANIGIDVDSETLARGTCAGSGAFEIKDGAVTADFPVLENGFQLSLYDGGVLTLDQNAAISDGGMLYVNGGTVQGADVITVNQGGYMYYDHGVMDGKIKENGGYFYYYESSSSGGIEFEQNTFTGMTLTFGQSASVHSGTVADSTTILVEKGSNTVSGYGASLNVFSGGIAKNTTVAGGGLHITSGGTALNTLVHSDGHMEIDYRGGASAINTTVKDGGEFMVSGGYSGTPFVSQTQVSSGGSLYLRPYNGEASMTDTIVSEGGVFYLSPEYSGYAVAVDTVIESGGTMFFTSGGSYSNVLLSGTVFKQGASVGYYVSSGDDSSSFYSYSYVRASDTILDSGASVALHNSESLSNTIVRDNAVLEIGSGVYASGINATGAGATVRVLSRGSVESALIGSGAVMTVDARGGADATVVDGGTMRITGSATDIGSIDTYINETSVTNGTVFVDGALLCYASAGAGGRIELSSNSFAYGVFTLTDGGEMHVEEGGEIFFLIGNYTAPSTQLLVNDLSKVTGAPKYNLVVSKYQARGTYVFASGAADFDGTLSVVDDDLNDLGSLKVNEAVKIGDDNYTLRLENGNLGVTITDVTGIGVSRGDIDNSGISDVLFQWTGGGYQLGYWMNGHSVEGGVSTWKCTGMPHSKDWDVLGNYVMDGDGNADTVLFGNVQPEGGFKGAYIGYYKNGIDLDENWVTIGYLTNEGDIDWKNKVGNLTGNADANSILWYAPELYALGVWKDGREDWQTISNSFGGADWTLAGCGDFDGDGRDSVVMSYNNGQMFYAVDLDGTANSMGSANWAGWEIRGIGDFSGDRKDDIVLFHQETGSMVLLADGNLDSYTSIGQLDPNDWFVVGAGDYNGDQKDDLLVRQYSTGTLGYYVCAEQNKWIELGDGVGMEWTVIA